MLKSTGKNQILLAIFCCGVIFCPNVFAAKTDVKKLVLNAKGQRDIQFAAILKLIKQAREAAYKEQYSDASSFYRKASRSLSKMSGELAEFKKRLLNSEMKKFKK